MYGPQLDLSSFTLTELFRAMERFGTAESGEIRELIDAARTEMPVLNEILGKLELMSYMEKTREVRELMQIANRDCVMMLAFREIVREQESVMQRREEALLN